MKHLNTSHFLLLVLLGILWSCKTPQPLSTVSSVNLSRYAGRWFEIARLPIASENDCNCVTATYKEEPGKNYVWVMNRCQDGSSGNIRKIKGKAFVQKGSNNSILKVQFFPLIKAPYYIMDLDTAYQYAMVGSPQRNYLWILSKVATMPAEVYDSMVVKAQRAGFNTSKLEKTNQSCSMF